MDTVQGLKDFYKHVCPNLNDEDIIVCKNMKVASDKVLQLIRDTGLDEYHISIMGNADGQGVILMNGDDLE